MCACFIDVVSRSPQYIYDLIDVCGLKLELYKSAIVLQPSAADPDAFILDMRLTSVHSLPCNFFIITSVENCGSNCESRLSASLQKN